MKKLTLLIVFGFILQTIIYSQPCLPEGIIFTSQTQIDNFQINHPNCTEIEGDVEIYGYDITSLLGLNVLTSIEGNLHIGDNIEGLALNNMTGLENCSAWFKSDECNPEWFRNMEVIFLGIYDGSFDRKTSRC